MRRAIVVAIASLLLASQASAYVSSGHSYSLECNASGFVLTSDYPVSRFVEQGADSWIWSDTERLYLGKNCDAAHELFGDGTWCWANGGFFVEFDWMRFGFPRQELQCPTQDDVNLACMC